MAEQTTILCVDDEPNVLRSLERLFLDSDYEIMTASSAQEGLSVMEATPGIQIIMSDYRMPGMDGVQFLREARRRWPDTVRIVLSGYADTAAVVGAINEGEIYKFIPKPWNDEELIVTVANAVERFQLYRKTQELMEELRLSNEKLQRLNDDLERKVAERTETLVFQNRVLMISQHILEVLPVGVMGIDPTGMIVQCNASAAEIVGAIAAQVLGNDRVDLLPPEVNAIIDAAGENSAAAATVHIFGRPTAVRAIRMDTCHQRGIVLQLQQG